MEKHKVLVFGDKTFGKRMLDVKSEYFDVTFQPFPGKWDERKRASNYSIVILDYSAFESLYGEEQNIFEKELFEGFDNGATICFLHYDEKVPGYDERNYEEGRMKAEDIKHLLDLQIGFRFLYHLSLRPYRFDRPIHWGQPKRTEFKKFLEKWGSSKNVFTSYGEGSFDDRIQSVGEYTLGFSHKFRKGLLVCLPCQRDFSNIQQTGELFSILIDNLITYITRIRTELPEFAREPFFPAEEAACQKLKEMKVRVEGLEQQLEPYNVAKSLAFASEYRFEELLPQFLRDEFGLSIEQTETYNEDFWLLDSTRKKMAICETKSYVKGFQKSGIYKIYNHREHYKLEESFPAILFVNLNLNAAGWSQKLTPIAPQDYEVATSNNILIVRTEDLLFMWDALKQNELTKENILEILTTKKGWLSFKSNHTYEIKE